MIINLTPHEINIHLADGSIRSIPSSGEARVASTSTPLPPFDGVPLVRNTYGAVTGLPAFVEGTLLIVSAMVASALPYRTDLASPGALVRDPEGRIIGCRTLVWK